MGFCSVRFCVIEFVGSLTYLVDYERQRQLQCLTRLLSIDSLNRLYSTKFSPIVALRSVGLSFVNEFSPFKVNFDFYLNKIHVHFL
jgi:2-polyprenyl-6-methoxyphenol hydroxylase-like FAD-dependent oxidoreductase